MTAPFESLEIQLVKSSLASRSDEELAGILERPVEEITALINELTGGQAEARTADISKMIDEKQQAINVKKTQVKKIRHVDEEKQKEKARSAERFKEKTSRIKIEEQRKRERDLQFQRRSFKTREVDQSQMKHVRVNRTTYVQVPKDIPDEVAIANYHEHITSKRDINFNQ